MELHKTWPFLVWLLVLSIMSWKVTHAEAGGRTSLPVLFVFAKWCYLVEASQEAQRYRMLEKRDAGLIPGSGRSTGGGDGNPLQFPYLVNRALSNIRAHVDVLGFFSWSFLCLVLEFLSITWKSVYTSRTLSTKSKHRKFSEPPNNEDEDEDVKAERLKVKELMSCQCCEEVS